MTNTVLKLEEGLDHIVAYSLSKEERELFVRRVIAAIDEGNLSALDVHLYLKQSESILDAIIKHPSFKDSLLTEAAKYGKSFDYRSAAIQVRDGRPTYDWSVCDDPELEKLQAAYDIAKAALDNRQKFLKNLQAPLTVVSEETGEVYTIYPPAKSSSTIVAVTLK